MPVWLTEAAYRNFLQYILPKVFEDSIKPERWNTVYARWSSSLYPSTLLDNTYYDRRVRWLKSDL